MRGPHWNKWEKKKSNWFWCCQILNLFKQTNKKTVQYRQELALLCIELKQERYLLNKKWSADANKSALSIDTVMCISNQPTYQVSPDSDRKSMGPNNGINQQFAGCVVSTACQSRKQYHRSYSTRILQGVSRIFPGDFKA